MAEFFSDWGLEVYISSSWVDLTPDVLSLSWQLGIVGNGPLDRIADPGYLTFTLDNSTGNSGAVLGYYSPGHASALSGWTTGLPVRLWFTWETITRYKWRGRIKTDGIRVEAGIYGTRTVSVSCEDYMAIAYQHELDLLTMLDDKTGDQVLPYITANMPFEPVATSYATGASTFPTVFDTMKGRTTAAAEMQKIALSEFGYIFVKGDTSAGETLVFQSRNTRSAITKGYVPLGLSECDDLLKEDGDHLLQETTSKIVLDETQEASLTAIHEGAAMVTNYGKNLANRVMAASYPRKVDAAATTVLFSLQKSFNIAAGETKTGYRCRYRDPSGGASYVNGKEMVTPVATTDYTANAAEGGGGADKTANLTVTATYGTDMVEYTLTNTDSATIWVTKLQARGKGIYIYDPVRVTYEDSTSQLAHGVHALQLDMKYQDNADVVDDFAQYVLGAEKDPNLTIDSIPILANYSTMNMGAFMCLEPGTKAHFTEAVTGVNDDYFINGYRAEMFGKYYILWTPCLIQSDKCSFGIWDQAEWDNAFWGVAEE